MNQELRKHYASRLRVHQLKEDEFNKWRYQAITKRDECNDGKITPEEYIEWMEAYFPNRKSYTNFSEVFSRYAL